MDIRIVEMEHVILQNRVQYVQKIVDSVHHRLPIVEMVPVMVESHALLAQEIVVHVHRHHLQCSVEMVFVTMAKIVGLVQMIVLEPTRVTIVLLQTGKHPLG